MKPFNLEEAKAGMPVCTKNGKDARIICFDSKVNSNETNMIVLVAEGDTELIYTYNNDGTSLFLADDYDLIMKPEHHIGYINIYKCNIGIKLVGGVIYNTCKQAQGFLKNMDKDIKTIKIEWEE